MCSALRSLCWGLLALACPNPAIADPKLVTEEAFVEALDEGHPAVDALGGGVALAEAARRRAGTLANPRFEFWRERPASNQSLTNWTIAWNPPLDGRYRLDQRASAAGVDVARADLAAARAEIHREMRRVFAAWSLAHARRALLTRQLDRVSELAEHERQRARTGATSGLAARRLHLARIEAETALHQAEAAHARAEAEARAWRPDLLRDASPVLPTLPEPPNDVDVDASPSVRRTEHEHERAQIEARLAGRFWGFPTLQLGVQRLEEAGATRSGPILAAGWSIPLFDRNQAQRARAESQVAIAAARRTNVRALTAGAARGGLEAYGALLAGVRAAHGTPGQTERVIEAATAAYEAGETGLTDLLAALRSAFVTRLLVLDLHEQALAAHRDLEAILGHPLSDGGAR